MEDLIRTVILLQGYQSAAFALLAFGLWFRNGLFSKQFLGWCLTACSLFFFTRMFCFTVTEPLFPVMAILGGGFLLALFPTYYFYIKSLIIKNYFFRSRDLRHLVPSLLLFLYLPLRQGMVAAWSAFNPFLAGRISEWLVYVLLTLQIVIYSGRISVLFRQHKINIERAYSDISRIRLSWVYAMMILMLSFLVVIGLSRITGLGHHDLFQAFCSLAEMLIILLFAVFSLIQPEIWEREVGQVGQVGQEGQGGQVRQGDEGMDDGTGGEEEKEKKPGDQESIELAIMRKVAEMTQAAEAAMVPEDPEPVRKYAGSGLTELQKRILARKLDRLMKEKFYLNEKLSIEQLAGELETNAKYLSQVINETHGQNFYTYVNSFRIAEARRLLGDRGHKKYSIQGIARMAGFSSKSTFNEAFRRITGMTPSEYLKKK